MTELLWILLTIIVIIMGSGGIIALSWMIDKTIDLVWNSIKKIIPRRNK